MQRIGSNITLFVVFCQYSETAFVVILITKETKMLQRNEQTHLSIASIASKGLQYPHLLTWHEIQQVCATALTQTPNKR